MLGLRRLVVLIVFAVGVSTVFLLWALGQPGADARQAFAPPPRAGAELEMLSSSMTTAVNVTRSADAGWVIRTAGQTGIPERALRAYVAAAVTVNAGAPVCGIGWNTLAAVGSVGRSAVAILIAPRREGGIQPREAIAVAAGERFGSVHQRFS